MEENIEIRDVKDPNEIKRFEDIQYRVWGGGVVPSHLITAVKEVGGVVKGAYYNDKLIGFVYGFIGRYKGRYCIYSHQLAVLPQYQNMGVGEKLKNEQMRWGIENGYDLIIWTFDPARAKNAWLNIGKLGVITDTYLIDHYGEMEDELNRGVPSDRFMVEWWIKSRWIKDRMRYRYDRDLDIKYETVLSLERSSNGIYPSNVKDVNDNYISIEIPLDFDDLGGDTLKLKKMWKLRLREAFIKYFTKGYTVIYFVRGHNIDKGIYILKRGFDPNDRTTW
ncbi:TPA: GNAT family N-acetyltransferase [Candidatus Geothermarchaeota archaeon]|nr:GNAT family N-acetyltransferase [Candidatus Geothermarchaeota archaeon]